VNSVKLLANEGGGGEKAREISKNGREKRRKWWGEEMPKIEDGKRAIETKRYVNFGL
jgi:hypothetical protein